ncbi:MAG TPA: phosphohistidine phosphatase SixA [Bacteroidota bacterium]
MVIYLLRHGDALQTPSMNDDQRPLSEIGERQARTVGRFLVAGKVRIDCVYSSPLVRAIQTAGIVRDALNVRKSEQTEYLVPGTRKSQLFDLLNAHPVESVLLVGHEPHLSQTTSLLLTEHENLPLEFKKCSLACLVASEKVRKGHAILQWFLTCEQMELLKH